MLGQCLGEQKAVRQQNHPPPPHPPPKKWGITSPSCPCAPRPTMSRSSLCSSLTMKIMSNRDRMVGIKSMFSSPLVSSQRPKTELAAASTEQRELSVVVIPACGGKEKRTGSRPHPCHSRARRLPTRSERSKPVCKDSSSITCI